MSYLVHLLVLLSVCKVIYCSPNGGHHHHHPDGHHGHDHDHDHSHDHGGHGHDHGHGEHDHDCGDEIDFSELIKGLGIKILGKDQESADDVSPAEDHNQLNVKALISELFSPSTKPPPITTTSRPRTSTEKLPIKSHWEGWFVSPVDLVMNNHILEPVYDKDIVVTTENPLYLTETQYYLQKDEDNPERFGPPTSTFERRSKQIDIVNHLDIDDLNKKPVIPVLDTRWANYHLVNNGTRKHPSKSHSAKENRELEADFDQKAAKPLHFKNKKENEVLLESLRFLVPPSQGEKVDEDIDPLLGLPQEGRRFNQNINPDFRPGVADDLQQVINEVYDESAITRVQNTAAGAVHRPPLSHVQQQVHRNAVQQQQLQQQQRRGKQNRQGQQQQQGNRRKSLRSGQQQHSSVRKSGLNHVQQQQSSVRTSGLSHVQQQIHNNAVQQQRISQQQQQPSLRTSGLSHVQQQIHNNAVQQQKISQQQQQHRFAPPQAGQPKRPESNRAQQHKVVDGGGVSDVLESQVRGLHNQLGGSRAAGLRNQISSSSPTRSPKLLSGKGNFNERIQDVVRPDFENKNNFLRGDIGALNDRKDQKGFPGVDLKGRQIMTFDCKGRNPGLYADIKSKCKRFIMCHENGRMGSFRCPSGTLFNQSLQICDWKKRVQC